MILRGNSNLLWLTWETQRRNSELAAAFGFRLLALDFSNYPSLIRYLLSAFYSLLALVREKPRVVVVQCPSIILVGFTLFFRNILKFRLVVDAHNISVERAISAESRFEKLYRKFLSQADLIIVSNSRLASRLRPFVCDVCYLPDKLPRLASFAVPERQEGYAPLLLVVASFAPDEPIEAILEAVCSIDRPVQVRVTGKVAKARGLIKFASDRIQFTDYLPAEDYDALLRLADLVVDLTDLPDCLVCGAYEALSAGVPAVVTDSQVNRDTFKRGFVYTLNDSRSIARAIIQALDNIDRLRLDLLEERSDFLKRWESNAQAVEGIILKSPSFF